MRSHLGDALMDCRILVFADASFAGDVKDSKSTSGMFMVLAGPNTWCPLSWMCKKQTAVSHSSAEAEIISLEAAMRSEALPVMELWDTAMDVFHPIPGNAKFDVSTPKPVTDNDWLSMIDYVPPSFHRKIDRAKIIILEDNDAVIQMCNKQRIPAMKHVSRTHRVNLDWLIDLIAKNDSITIRFVGTKSQAADIMTKGSFNEPTWKALLRLIQVQSLGKPCFDVKPPTSNVARQE